MNVHTICFDNNFHLVSNGLQKRDENNNILCHRCPAERIKQIKMIVVINRLILALCFTYLCVLWPQVLTKRLKHSAEKYKDLQVNYDELKMFSEKVRERRLDQWFLLGGQLNPRNVMSSSWVGSVIVLKVKIQARAAIHLREIINEKYIFILLIKFENPCDN